jgi:sortase A
VLSSSTPGPREESATEVAARASEAAVRAANAAIVAANAAISAARAAVRLIDERDHKVITLAPGAAPPRLDLPPASSILDHAPTLEEPKVIHLPATADLTAAIHLPARADLRPATTAPRRARSLRGLSLRALAIALIVGGVLLLIDATVTLVWQEPISALYASVRQDHLSSALRREERAVPATAERTALAQLRQQGARIAYLAAALQHRAHDGSPVGRIRIPRTGMNFVVVNGTSTAALQGGPGIFPATVYPGVAGTTAIAGHRTTYLAPFRHIDQLSRGDRILLNMPYAAFTYTVIGKRVVAPTDVRDAVANVGYSRLVLSACTPLFSAAKRLLVFARLTRTVAVGAGRLSVTGAVSRHAA